MHGRQVLLFPALILWSVIFSLSPVAGFENENYWTIKCKNSQDDKKAECQMESYLQDGTTKERKIIVIIQQAKGISDPLLLVLVRRDEIGSKELEIQVDEGKVRKFPIRITGANWAHAIEPVSKPFLDSLRRGRFLWISGTYANGGKMRAPIGLPGFTKTFRKLHEN